MYVSRIDNTRFTLLSAVVRHFIRSYHQYIQFITALRISSYLSVDSIQNRYRSNTTQQQQQQKYKIFIFRLFVFVSYFLIQLLIIQIVKYSKERPSSVTKYTVVLSRSLTNIATEAATATAATAVVAATSAAANKQKIFISRVLVVRVIQIRFHRWLVVSQFDYTSTTIWRTQHKTKIFPWCLFLLLQPSFLLSFADRVCCFLHCGEFPSEIPLKTHWAIYIRTHQATWYRDTQQIFQRKSTATFFYNNQQTNEGKQFRNSPSSSGISSILIRRIPCNEKIAREREREQHTTTEKNQKRKRRRSGKRQILKTAERSVFFRSRCCNRIWIRCDLWLLHKQHLNGIIWNQRLVYSKRHGSKKTFSLVIKH